MGLRNRLERLEREAEGEMLVILQRDGTVKRFPAGAGIDAYMNLMDRLGPASKHHPSTRLLRQPGTPASRIGCTRSSPWRTLTSGYSPSRTSPSKEARS